MNICEIFFPLVLWLAGVDDPGALCPPSWTLGAPHVRTRGAHEHDWIEGPRGGVYYWTERGTKVYRHKGKSDHG